MSRMRTQSPGEYPGGHPQDGYKVIIKELAREGYYSYSCPNEKFPETKVKSLFRRGHYDIVIGIQKDSEVYNRVFVLHHRYKVYLDLWGRENPGEELRYIEELWEIGASEESVEEFVAKKCLMPELTTGKGGWGLKP